MKRGLFVSILLLIALIGNSQSHEIEWINIVGTSVTASNELKKVATSSWDNGVASSENIIQRETEGYLSFTVGENPEPNFAVGFIDVNAVNSVENIQTGFYFKGEDVHVFVSGFEIIASSVGVITGDVFKMEILEGVIYFWKNGEDITEVADDWVNTDRVICANIYEQNEIIPEVVCSTPAISSNEYNNYWTDGTGVKYNNINGTIVNNTASSFWGVSGAHSKNQLGEGEDGSFTFSVHHRFMGYVGWITSFTGVTQKPTFGFLFKSGKVYVYVDGGMYSSNGTFSYLDTYKLLRINGIVYLYKNGELLFSASNSSAYYSFVSLKNSTSFLSHFSDGHVSYKYKNQIDQLQLTAFDSSSINGEATVNFSTSENIYAFWDDEQPMDSSEYSDFKSNQYILLSQVDSSWALQEQSKPYSTYLSEHSNSIVSKNGSHQLTMYDADDDTMDVYDIRIPLDIKFTAGAMISEDSATFSSLNTGWSNSIVAFDNGILSGETNAEVEVELFDVASKYVFGLRNDQSTTSNVPRTDYDYGFEISDYIIYTLYNGVRSTLYERSTPGCRIQLEIDGEQIYYKVDGVIVRSETYDNSKAYLMDLVLKKGTVFKPRPYENICYIPKVIFDNPQGLCGMNYQVVPVMADVRLRPKDVLLGKMQSLQWFDNYGNQVGTGPTLTTNIPGIYWFNQTVGGTAYYPRMVIVGYDVEWTKHVNSVSLPTNNSLKVTLPIGQINIMGSAESVNQGIITNGIDHFYSTEVNKPLNQLGSAAFLNSDMVGLGFIVNGGTNILSWMYNFGGQYKVSNFPNGIYTGINVEDGDHLVMLSDGTNGNVSFYVNGIMKLNIGAPNLLPSATTLWGSGRKVFSLSKTEDWSSVLYNCITSIPCPEVVYYELKRKMNAEYYWANTDKVAFRYIEEYNQQSNDLNYEIIAGDGNIVLTSANPSDPQLQKEFGDNIFLLDLYPYRTLLPADFYTMKVINEKSEVRYLKFKLD